MKRVRRPMMRTRLLKPGFFRNPILGQLSEGHRLLFAGLWLLADREGRLRDDPDWIRAELFPYSPFRNVEKMLADLATKGLIVRYAGPSSSCGKPVEKNRVKTDTFGSHTGASEELFIKASETIGAIYIPTFFRHQHPHPREAASALPVPPLDLTPIVAPDTEGTAKDRPRPVQGNASPVLILDLVSKDLKAGALNGGPPTSSPADAGPSRPSAEEPKPKKPTPPDEPDRNLSIITKIAHEAISLLGPESPDLPDTIKGLCAYRGISYNAAVVGKALDSARVQQQRLRQSHDAH